MRDWVMVCDYRQLGSDRWCQAQVKAIVPRAGGRKQSVETACRADDKSGIKSGSVQLGESGPREDSEGPPPIICQEAATTNPTCTSSVRVLAAPVVWRVR